MSRPRDGAGAACAASAARLRDALFDLYADCDQVPAPLISYALADLRHLCDCEGVSFAAKDKAGHLLYRAELAPITGETPCGPI